MATGRKRATGGCSIRAALVVSCALVFGLVDLDAQGPGFASARAESEGGLNAVKRKIEALKESLFSRKGKAEKLDTALRAVESERARLEKALRQQRLHLEERQAHLAALKRRRAILGETLQHHRTALQKQLRTAFTIGRQEKLKLLLNQENPALVGRTLVYYDYFNRNRADQIQEALASLEELNGLETEITQTVEDVENALAALEQEREAIEKLRKERAELLASLKEEIVSDEKELERLEADRARLQALVDRVAEESRRRPPERRPDPEPEPQPASGPEPAPERSEPERATALAPPQQDFRPDKPIWQQKGSLPWPTAGTVSGRFGQTRNPNTETTWQGVYIESESGREVRAVSSGRVAFAEWIRGFGLMIILDHGGGYMSLYGHNQSIFRETGERVKAGDVIASVGDSGGQGAPGLYFEIRNKGKPQNPEKWCDTGSPLVQLSR